MAATPTWPGGHIEVLIAEDDPHIRAIVLDVVSSLGHATSCAANGVEALDLFNARGADVVVSDWMMPRMDGEQLCRCVRSQLSAPYTYFILLTAVADAEHLLAGMRAGADDYVAKPFNLSDIEARLIVAERVTAMHRQREALLGQARRLVAETDPARVLDDLLRDAVALVGGSAGIVTRWDDQALALLPVGAAPPNAPRVQLGEGATGRAAQHRTPVRLQRAAGDELDPALTHAPLEAVVAVPLLDQSRLVGTLTVGSVDRVFTREDVDLLEMMAATAVSALVALEHARLDGVLLAARTAQHELNNQLAVARGYAELLAGADDLPRHLVDLADEVKHATDAAASVVRQLRGVSHICEQHWPAPAETTINLSRSQH